MATVKVSFAELRTTGYYSNMRAEASIEEETTVPEFKIPELLEQVREQVREQLDAEQQFRAGKEKGHGEPAEEDENEPESFSDDEESEDDE